MKVFAQAQQDAIQLSTKLFEMEGFSRRRSRMFLNYLSSTLYSKTDRATKQTNSTASGYRSRQWMIVIWLSLLTEIGRMGAAARLMGCKPPAAISTARSSC
jgi:hypothetical protein